MKNRCLSTVSHLCPLLCAAGLLAGSQATLHAQTVDTWNGGTGNWSDSTFWNNGVPNSASADVFIDGGKTSVNSVVTLDNSYTVGRLTIDAGDTLNFNNGTTLNLTAGGFTGSGTLTNNGTINVNAGGNLTSLGYTGATTLAGTGVLKLNGTNATLFANNGGDRLTINAGATIAGAGNLGQGRSAFTNNGTVNANSSGNTLVIQPGGGSANAFTNGPAGLAEASGGGTLQLDNPNNIGTVFTNNGIFAVISGSTGGNSSLSVYAGGLTNFSGSTLTGGTYNVLATDPSATSTLSFGGGSIVTNNANISLDGPGTIFNEVNTLANNASGGNFQLNHGRNFTTVGALTNAGVIQVRSGSNLSVQGTLTSSGQLFAASNGSIASTGALTQTAAGTLFGSGSVTAPSLALPGSLRPGDGLAQGPVPFAAIGTLTLNGQVGLTSDTVLIFDLASTAASDRISVNGALTLAGMLNVNAFPGFGAGRYDLIDYTGALTNNGLALGTLPSGYNYAIDTSMGGQVDLVVTNVVPEPSTWAGALLGLGLLLVVYRRRRTTSLI